MKTKLEYKCSVCNEVKSTSDFYKAAKARNGLSNRCKVCDLLYQRNRKKQKATSNKKWYEANKDTRLAIARAKTRSKRIAVYETKMQKISLDKWRKDRAKRHLHLSLSTPQWARTKEHMARKTEIYAITHQLQEVTGCIYHVDHIVPLQSELVCGLNVWWNLQPLPEKSNISKNNLFEPRLFPEQGEVAFPSGDGLLVAQICHAQRMENDTDE